MADPVQISAFRQLIDLQVNEFISASEPFGEPLTAMAHKVKRAFEMELNFLIAGVSAPRPDGATFNIMVQPLCDAISEIQEFRDRNRHNEEFFNHLSTVSESIVALSWISVKVAPVQFIRDMKDAGEYFGNRVLSTHRGNHLIQTWINKWNDILRGLEQYVKDQHLTGFDWGAAARATGCGEILPPPPPPPPSYGEVMTVYDVRESGDSTAIHDGRHALLNQINQGVDIVRMLRPVRNEQASQPQQFAAGGMGDNQFRQPPTERSYPPKFFLEGRKWRVEHQKDNYALTVDNREMSESLAMFKCQNIALEVQNKMNGVTIDNCKRSTIVLHDIISSVELIRCERVKLQCCGHVPLISLDNCDSVQVFLTDESIGAEFISSKSTSLNVCLLAPDGDYTELAVPEQIKTVVQHRKLLSSVVEKI